MPRTDHPGNDAARNEKPIEWWGDSLDVLRACPVEVQQDTGYALGEVQQGRMPPQFDYLSVLGAGVIEIKVSHDKETYRTIYVAKFAEAVHVLHVFQKKSRRGKELPKRDRNLIQQRYKDMTTWREAQGFD